MEITNIDYWILSRFTGSESVFVDSMAMYLTNAWVWVPMYLALLFLVIRNNKTFTQILLIFGCGILGVAFAGGFSDLFVKPYFARLRPYYDPEVMYQIHRVMDAKINGYSFFSSHSANTFSLAMFFTLLVRGRTLSIMLFSWAAVNAWTRIYLGAHFFTDVLAGTVWGLLVGIVVYLIYHKVFYMISPHGRYVSTSYTATGYSYKDIDVVLFVFAATLLLGLINSLL